MIRHTAAGLAFSIALHFFADSVDKSLKFGALSTSLSSYFLQMSLLNCYTLLLRHYHNNTTVYGTLTHSTMNKLSRGAQSLFKPNAWINFSAMLISQAFYTV